MRVVWLELLQPTLHGFDLPLEQIILLAGIMCVFCIVLEAVEFVVQALF